MLPVRLRQFPQNNNKIPKFCLSWSWHATISFISSFLLPEALSNFQIVWFCKRNPVHVELRASIHVSTWSVKFTFYWHIKKSSGPPGTINIFRTWFLNLNIFSAFSYCSNNVISWAPGSPTSPHQGQKRTSHELCNAAFIWCFYLCGLNIWSLHVIFSHPHFISVKLGN